MLRQRCWHQVQITFLSTSLNYLNGTKIILSNHSIYLIGGKIGFPIFLFFLRPIIAPLFDTAGDGISYKVTSKILLVQNQVH